MTLLPSIDNPSWLEKIRNLVVALPNSTIRIEIFPTKNTTIDLLELEVHIKEGVNVVFKLMVRVDLSEPNFVNPPAPPQPQRWASFLTSWWNLNRSLGVCALRRNENNGNRGRRGALNQSYLNLRGDAAERSAKSVGMPTAYC